MRALGQKAIDLRRVDREYVKMEEDIVAAKTRNGILAGGVALGAVIGLLKAFPGFFRNR